MFITAPSDSDCSITEADTDEKIRAAHFDYEHKLNTIISNHILSTTTSAKSSRKISAVSSSSTFTDTNKKLPLSSTISTSNQTLVQIPSKTFLESTGPNRPILKRLASPNLLSTTNNTITNKNTTTMNQKIVLTPLKSSKINQNDQDDIASTEQTTNVSSANYSRLNSRGVSSTSQGTSKPSVPSSATIPLEDGKQVHNLVPSTQNNLASGTISNTKTNPTRKRKKIKVTICTAHTRYEVIRRVSRKLGWREVAEDDEWMLFWTDCSVALDRVMNMKRYQKINHFPGMSEICRKDHLARNMNRLFKQFPKEYNIFPKSWVLPADYGDFQNYYRLKKGRCYIVKPEVGCQGKGIYVTKNPSKDINATDRMVIQQYISKPLLMDGFKFDLRVYVLVSSCDPLRIYWWDVFMGSCDKMVSSCSFHKFLNNPLIASMKAWFALPPSITSIRQPPTLKMFACTLQITPLTNTQIISSVRPVPKLKTVRKLPNEVSPFYEIGWTKMI